MTTATGVRAAWYDTVDDAPPDTTPAPTPYRTRAWARAWQTMRTEPVLAHHHLCLEHEDTAETISCFLVGRDGGPYWRSQEADAGMTGVWPGPVLYAGCSPHAEYGGAGSATSAVATAAARAIRGLAADLGACAVVYPGLTRAQAHLLTAGAAAAAATGDTVLDVALDVAHVRPLGADMREWYAGVPAHRRGDVRRQGRRGHDAGLRLLPLAGEEVLTSEEMRPLLGEFTDLANSTAERHGTALYGTDMVRGLAAVPGAVLLAAMAGDRLVGGMYGWAHAGCLYLWAGGLDHSHAAARWTYTWMVGTAGPRWAIDQGLTHIDSGRANYRAKIRMGFRPRVLRTVVHLLGQQPLTQDSVSELSSRIGAQAAPYLPEGVKW